MHSILTCLFIFTSITCISFIYLIDLVRALLLLFFLLDVAIGDKIVDVVDNVDKTNNANNASNASDANNTL